MPKLIAQGAEAKLFKEKNSVIKDRFAKKYRHPELDVKLRKSRTKREAKVLEKLKVLNIPCSEYISHSDKTMQLEMQFIEGDVLKNVFDKDHVKFSKLIAQNIAAMHRNDIIHGDLTTSNMIYGSDKLHFIDFGLSFFSNKIEDKAVDLHLLKQALESKHYYYFDEAFNIILKEYAKHYPEAEEIIKRLDVVEKRGRYKHQV